MGSGIRRTGSKITALGSGIADHQHGIGVSSFFQGSGCNIFVGSVTKMGHAFGIKDQKFANKNGISEEKTYLVTTLRKQNQPGVSFCFVTQIFAGPQWVLYIPRNDPDPLNDPQPRNDPRFFPTDHEMIPK